MRGGWLGSYDIGRDYAAGLFEDVQLATVTTVIEHTAVELNALLATMSSWQESPPSSATPSRARITRFTSVWVGQSGRAHSPEL